ncbi:MAG: glutaredoxin 3 [Alphaproteobacteria bacterium]
MSGPHVVIYTTPWCGFCSRARRLLERKGVGFEEIDVTDPAARAAMRERTGGPNSVPQIFIGERHVGGCDELYALEAGGSLEPLLAGEAS